MCVRIGFLAALLFGLSLSGCNKAETASGDSPAKASINGGKATGSDKTADKSDEKWAEKYASTGADDTAGSEPAEPVSFDAQLDEVVAASQKLPPAELAEGLVNLARQRGHGKDQDEAKANHLKLHRMVVKLAEQVLSAKDAGDEAQTNATIARWMSTAQLSQWDEPGASEQFRKLTLKLAEHPNADLARAARLKLLSMDAGKLMDDDKGADDVAKRLVAALEGKQVDGSEMKVVQDGLFVLEATGRIDLATKVYDALAALAGRVGNPEMAEMLQKDYDTAMRRFGWLGKSIELEGTHFDGEAFDLGKHRGKVLLVDFWATWCPPCMQELPNLLETHKQYQESGFEVIGIALDDDRDTLSQFLDDRKLPWVTLWSAVKDQQMYDDPLAKKFGVDGIPRTFLVDRQGKVVAIGLHGKRLRAKIAELLGAEADKTGQVSETSNLRDARSGSNASSARVARQAATE